MHNSRQRALSRKTGTVSCAERSKAELAFVVTILFQVFLHYKCVLYQRYLCLSSGCGLSQSDCNACIAVNYSVPLFLSTAVLAKTDIWLTVGKTRRVILVSLVRSRMTGIGASHQQPS